MTKLELARMVCYAFIGGVLASGGVTWRNWQLYVVLLLVGAVATISEIIVWRKCP